MNMNKKTYEKPTMIVVKLQQQSHLLAGSGGESDQMSGQQQDYESEEW